MKSVNRVTLVGNLGKDPELKRTAEGMSIAHLSIATNGFRKNGGWVEVTEWHNVVAWDKLAEQVATRLKKGSKVYVEGRLQTRSWDDKESGQKRYITEIVASDLIFLDAIANREA
jgi:single-strand DNA-binding protein